MTRLRLALLVSMMVACRTPEPAVLTPEIRAGVVEAVTTAMQGYAAAFPTRDADAITAFYLNDPDFRTYFDGTVSTYTEMVAMVRGMMGGLRSVEGAFENIQVSVLGPTAAVATSPFRDVLVDTAGVTTRLKGVVSWTWVQRPEGWRIIHGNAIHVPDTTAAGSH